MLSSHATHGGECGKIRVMNPDDPGNEEQCIEDAQIVEVETTSCLFSVGDCFDSLPVVEEQIRQYESIKFVQFWKREARTIEVARKRVNRYLNPKLKYHEIKYCCIHGGQKFKSQGKGMRNVW